MANAEPPQSPEEMAKARFAEQFEAGQYSDALASLVVAIGQQIEGMLTREGFELNWEQPPDGGHSYFAGLAVALDRLQQAEGEEASYKLPVARDLATSVAILQELIATLPASGNPEALARLLIQAFRIGVGADHLGLAVSGLLDEYGELKFANEGLKERQRQAARLTNEKRGSVRLAAVAKAAEIAGRRPRLNNEELALAIRAELGLNTSIGTITRWVREGRQSSKIPAKRTD